jgi:hypothetical protein
MKYAADYPGFLGDPGSGGAEYFGAGFNPGH